MSSSLRTARRVAALVPVCLAVTLVSGACSGADDEVAPDAPTSAGAGTPTGPRYARYVALGDSFAALGPTAAPTTGPPACERSTRDYPALLADRPEVGDLVDVTCGSARTDHMTSAQSPATPPQFAALTPDTDLVTLTIGGNDIGFGAMVDCVVRTPRVPDGAPCRERLGPTVSTALDGLGTRLDAVYAGIRERSPDARIVSTAYLPLVPPVGGCGFTARMSPGDLEWAREVTGEINRVVTEAADRAGVRTVLPADADERSACAAPAERYTDFTGIETGSHPMHPTAEGHRAMARAIAAVL